MSAPEQLKYKARGRFGYLTFNQVVRGSNPRTLIEKNAVNSVLTEGTAFLVCLTSVVVPRVSIVYLLLKNGVRRKI